MTSPREYAQKIIATFNPNASRKVVEVIAELLQKEGHGKFQAHIEADKLSFQVLEILNDIRPEELPFDFGVRDPTRLVGKARRRKNDTQETIIFRELWQFISHVLNVIYKMDETAFEILCAACLKSSGASEAYALCSRDEGGIDIFGKIPMGYKPLEAKPGIMEANLLKGNILFLGQCKRHNPRSEIGPGQMRDFIAAVSDCLRKYEGNPKPPHNRVPESYYKKNEPCIPIFMTTANYSEKSKALAQSNHIRTLSGKQITEFVCSRKIGFVFKEGTYQFKENLFSSWLQQMSTEVDYEKPKKYGPNKG